MEDQETCQTATNCNKSDTLYQLFLRLIKPICMLKKRCHYKVVLNRFICKNIFLTYIEKNQCNCWYLMNTNTGNSQRSDQKPKFKMQNAYRELFLSFYSLVIFVPIESFFVEFYHYLGNFLIGFFGWNQICFVWAFPLKKICC